VCHRHPGTSPIVIAISLKGWATPFDADRDGDGDALRMWVPVVLGPWSRERAGAVYCLAMRWDWQAIGTIVAIAAVAVTLIFNLLSQRQTRAGQHQDREMFEATAQRSEAAAGLTERYTQRVVDALEAIAQSGIGGGPARLPKVAWSMDHHVGDTYRLTNTGDAKAWNVTLTSDETLELLNVEGGPDIGEGEALTFMASVHWAPATARSP
jgi:hypothetical protein